MNSKHTTSDLFLSSFVAGWLMGLMSGVIFSTIVILWKWGGFK